MKERKKIAPVKEKELLYPENRIETPWRSAKRHLILTISVIVLVALLVLAIVSGYFFDWSWTGFSSTAVHAKTLWDWLQLLIIPVVLVIVGSAINFTIRSNVRAEQEIAIDNQREVALQTYIGELSELMLRERLRESQPMNDVRKIARVRTLTVLSRLDSERKRSVLQFLHESHLIDKGKPIVDLSRADLVRTHLVRAELQGANLVRVDLREANLLEANLVRADLSGANLSGANLEGTNLESANLEGANTEGANLSNTRLWGARITREQLLAAGSSNGAIGLDENIGIEEEPMPRHTSISTD